MRTEAQTTSWMTGCTGWICSAKPYASTSNWTHHGDTPRQTVETVKHRKTCPHFASMPLFKVSAAATVEAHRVLGHSIRCHCCRRACQYYYVSLTLTKHTTVSPKERPPPKNTAAEKWMNQIPHVGSTYLNQRKDSEGIWWPRYKLTCVRKTTRRWLTTWCTNVHEWPHHMFFLVHSATKLQYCEIGIPSPWGLFNLWISNPAAWRWWAYPRFFTAIVMLCRVIYANLLLLLSCSLIHAPALKAVFFVLFQRLAL